MNLKLFLAAALLGAMTCGIAQAQWSIGAPGSREAPAGKHRYSFFVFANPVPGKAAEFNYWYNNNHMGDLVQLPGWVGAQRFLLVTTVTPRPTAAGYRHGYLINWEIEETSANVATDRMIKGIQGGKSRRSTAYDYTRGVNTAAMYEVAGPRITRADGKGPTIPAADDYTTVRPGRYMLLEFTDPKPGKEAGFEQAIDQRIAEVLKLPGWLAAQRFVLATDAEIGGHADKPKFLTVWEIEGDSAQAANQILVDATAAGKVSKLPYDENTAEITYWEPISPYITEEDFQR